MKETYKALCQWGHRKIIYGITLFCLLITISGSSVLAQDRKVNDGADLLTVQEESKLQERLEEIAEKHDCDIAVTTTESTDGKSPMQYADDYYEENGYGIGPDYDGLMLLISMEERDWWITTFGMAIPAFTDYGIQRIGDIIVDPLGEGEYYDAFMEFADLADEFLTEYESGTPYDVDHKYETPMPLAVKLTVSVVLGLTAALAVLLILRSQLKSVGYEKTAVDYVKEGSFHLRKQRDLYLYRNVTRTKIERNNSSGGGGGSSTHRTSSGRSSGGGGGKF